MANKYVALLLAVCLVVAGAVEDQAMELPKPTIQPQATSEQCYNYCYNACLLPSAFCSWMCGGRCKNPILFDNVNSHEARKVLGPSLSPVSAVAPKGGRHHLE